MGLLSKLGLGKSARRQASGSLAGAEPAPSAPGTASGPHSGSQGSTSSGTAPLQPPPLPPPLAVLVQCALQSEDAETTAAAVEQLLEAAKEAPTAAALGCDTALVSRLRDLLAGGGCSGAAVAGGTLDASAAPDSRERLAMLAAYLTSSLAGKAAAADAALLDQRLLPALVVAAGVSAASGPSAACGWGITRGALRAISKLLEAEPACAAAQLLACGGVADIGALLAADDTGVVRRCLAILHTTSAAAPGSAFRQALLAPAPLAALLGLLGGRHRTSSSGTEVVAVATGLLALLAQEPGAAKQLGAAGAGPALAALAAAQGSEVGRLATEALLRLRHQGGWQPAAAAMQRAASSGEVLPPGQASRGWLAQLGRAASAPSPLPTVPEQPVFGGRGSSHRRGSTGLAGIPPDSSYAKVQRWQEQQAATQGGGGGYGGPDLGGPAALGGGGGTSVAHLVASLGSDLPRTQLAAAEQLAALAASGARAAAVVGAAGGAAALLACVCECAAGPVDIRDTLQDAFASTLSQSICTAALRALCTLCQQDAAAAAALPPAADPTLRLLMAGPDPQQRQLAAMLLASMQAAGDGQEPMLLAGHGAYGQLAAAAGFASSELLRTSENSWLSSLPPHPAEQQLEQQQQQQQGQYETPASVLHRQHSSGSGGSGSGRRSWALLQGLPSHAHAHDHADAHAHVQARRQVSGELQTPTHPQHRKPPLPQPASGQRNVWGPPHSECSTCEHVASPPVRAPSAVGDVFGSEAGGGGGGGCTAAGDPGHMLQRSDIILCQDSAGSDWRLGEGGFGVVYRGLMHGVDEVAVKRIKADAPSAEELATFQREAQLLARLHHRNVVQYYGACLEPGSLMIVTELLKGGDLYGALRRHPDAFRWDRLGRKVALDVALGLNYLHSQRPPLSHRDLKSPNVLLSEEGVAKIGDVGMVRQQSSHLATASPLMTPLWAAPEVMRRERAGVKADIWSYGVLVWELASGQDITRFQPLSMARQIQGLPAAGAAQMEMPADTPQAARHIFASCTQLDPSLRPNAQQVIEWLRGGKVCSCCAV